MAFKDHDKHYVGLVADVPNTVSRNAKVGDRSFVDVVAESGKPILDTEVNLRQDILAAMSRILARNTTPSGWFRGQSHADAVNDYTLGTVPANFAPIGADDGGFPVTAVDAGDGTLLDAILLPRLEATVAGYPVVVEYTNTKAAGLNLIELEAARIYDGTPAAFKRTDFVWLEVWLALVAPSPRATGYVQIVDAATLAASTITINGNVLLAVAGAPGVDEFQVDAGSEVNTAANVAVAINSLANSFAVDVLAVASADFVIIKSQVRGVAGNAITLSVTPSVPGNIVASGVALIGGADRPNKPATAQGQVYRHGNTLSHADTWLDDEMLDPTIDIETSQRVQVQYRIRSTGTSESVNFKKHLDGFSNPGGTRILAQGGEAAPVANYPFVPADGASTDLNTDASAYGLVDDGLWVAGDGSSTSAVDLKSLDGYVYALPICLVFRHNNVSSAAAGFKGFDPLNNTNGAPLYGHGGYNGPLGPIPAGASDRPDGGYADVISRFQILDQRRHVSMTGFNLAAEVEYQMQSLLDGSTRTWAIDAASKQTLGGSSGDVGTQFLVCNEIGRGPGAPEGGTPPFSGATNRGVFVRNFDHVARRFGDQPVIERAVFAYYPGDRPDNVSQGDPALYAHGEVNLGKYVVKTGGGVPVSVENWYEGDVLHLDLANFNVSTLGGVFQGLDGGGNSAAGIGSPTFTNYAPAGTKITDVLSIRHDDGHYFLAGPGVTLVSQDVTATLIQGLGTDHLTVALDANDNPASGGLALTVLSINIAAPGVLYAPGDVVTIGVPDIAGGVQATAVVATVDGGGGVLTVTITNPGSGYTTSQFVSFGGLGIGAMGTTVLQGEYRMVGGPDAFGVPVVDGSPRRLLLEVEITYPIGVGTTDTPDLTLIPDASVYDGTGAGPGAILENSTTQRPNDFDAILAPQFREGYREIGIEYVANDTVGLLVGDQRTGSAIGAVDQETVVSVDTAQLRFPRRVYGASAGFYANQTLVNDLTDTVSSLRVVDEATSEFGSSTRLVNLDTGGGGGAIPLSGPGQTLCSIEYFAQDPVPNYGAAGGGYQVSVYFRSNAPQTAGTKESDITTTGDGLLPTTLNVEPLLMSRNLWTGQTGTGSVDLAFPYSKPLDQIAVNDGTPLTGLSPNQIAGTIREWYFAATAQSTIADFDAATGLLALHPFVQGDVQNVLSLGGTTNDQKPRKDNEFRAYYPFTDTATYRPTVMSQPLFGAVRHKVFTPFLARATEDVPGVAGGLMFRKNEILLIVLSRFAELDDDNTVRFVDPVGDNRTCAALYRTRNLLLVQGA